ncbi:MAG: hypothetical protein K2P84_05965 [Undibacterium sp.]|nr:hypothetical protein [Undibacterium sp.]
MKNLLNLLIACVFGVASMSASADTITNADIFKLLEAGMPESVILQSIASNTTKFNTNADSLIKLKNKGATPAILQAMMNPKGVQASSASVKESNANATTANAKLGNKLNPEEIIVVTAGQESTMQYIMPQMRTAARAFGFGGVASYAVLPGTKAARRLSGDGIEFLVNVPKNVQAVGYLTVANFAIRENGTREVLTGGGYMSYSSGISKDRVIPVKSEALPDQSRAREGFVLYKITPERSLPTGEYAFILYTQEIRTAGFFATGANSYFDFGVD